MSMSFSTPARAPVVGREIHRLLRRAGAFDRHRRLGEERPAAAHLLHQLPGVGREVVAVVRGHAVAPERLGQALDGAPVELEPGQTTSRPYFTTRQPSRITASFSGSKAATAALIQFTPRGITEAIVRAVNVGLEHAGADQRPAGLVVVHVGRDR
jgi:hypothetical protein